LNDDVTQPVIKVGRARVDAVLAPVSAALAEARHPVDVPPTLPVLPTYLTHQRTPAVPSTRINTSAGETWKGKEGNNIRPQ